MSWKTLFVCAALGCAIGVAGCSREVVPGTVRARVAYRELNPAGTWVRDDGSGGTLTLTAPTGRAQIFSVLYRDAQGELSGEALVDGTTVYAARHTGSGPNDVLLTIYERRDDGALQGIWAGARHGALLGYEEAHPSRQDGWDGVYQTWGNQRGNHYHQRLLVGRAIDGTEGVHRLHWTESDHGWWRGMAIETGDRLVGVCTPGVLVHTSSWSAGNVTVTTRQTEVGSNVLWFVGAYRLEGDALVGPEITNARPGITQVRWVRPGGETHVAPAIAPAPEPPAAEPTPSAVPAVDPGAATNVAPEPPIAPGPAPSADPAVEGDPAAASPPVEEEAPSSASEAIVPAP